MFRYVMVTTAQWQALVAAHVAAEASSTPRCNQQVARVAHQRGLLAAMLLITVFSSISLLRLKSDTCAHGCE